MVSEFEQRFADVLGGRLPSPFTGRVEVPPAQAPDVLPRLVLAVSEMTVIEPDFRSRRPEVVTGSPDPRRVVRLECGVTIEVRRADDQSRADQMQVLDATLFALGDEQMLSGGALNDNTDRGFFIQTMHVSRAGAPVDPSPQEPVIINVVARGLFWPVGVPGQAGPEITEIFMRSTVLPVQVIPATPQLTAGGPAVDFIVHVVTPPSFRVHEGGEILFGSLAFTALAADGGPSAGTLAGGTEGKPGVRVVPLVDNEAIVTYAPPAEPGREDLVISIEDHEGGQGLELRRVRLQIRGA